MKPTFLLDILLFSLNGAHLHYTQVNYHNLDIGK